MAVALGAAAVEWRVMPAVLLGLLLVFAFLASKGAMVRTAMPSL
jgi:hypothetical protein